MNHSDDWRFLFPVSSFSAPPSLAPSAPDAYGPLLFTPLPPPATLLTLPFPFQPPHPSTSTSGLRDDLRYFLSRSTSFLPSSDLDSISGTLLAPPFPPPSNLLAALRTRSSRSLLLFFPSGENAEHVSYVALDSIANSISTTPLSPTLESDGFVHPGHRIHQLATTSRDSSWSWPPSQSAAGVEGFLLAATLHSVNWFKVEWRSVAGSPAAALVPAAKQAFDVGVVHACWSKHLQSECLVLLENGQLCCFDLDTRRQMKLGFGNSEDDDWGIWLSCEYGPQPWTVIVASTKAIFLVDLRYGDHCEYKYSQYLFCLQWKIATRVQTAILREKPAQ
ncbi:hypothetical protein E2562_012947 [Oryza meyeriana var. granulata]|uniref:Uncharacterized protein n=1 Tax=Oryza meyeriana var. granulata TaxID=110450 RepID=A0A6G1DI11_9ORYZ|nr:hypothetical protein E2562_012947 [Oryza meyeriana var. granulata]